MKGNTMNDNQPIDGQVAMLALPKQFKRPVWTVGDESDIQTRSSDGAAAIAYVSEIFHFDTMDRDGALQPRYATAYLCQDTYLTLDGIEAHRPYMHLGTEGDPYFTADQARAFATKILELADVLDAN